MLLQQESECQPSLMVPRIMIKNILIGVINCFLKQTAEIQVCLPRRLLVMVMLHVRQFSSAEGKGRSSHPKSGTVSLKGPGPDQTQLLSLSKLDEHFF